MALYHKWGVKTGFTFALQFFMLISDSLGGVQNVIKMECALLGMCLFWNVLKNEFAQKSMPLPYMTI